MVVEQDRFDKDKLGRANNIMKNAVNNYINLKVKHLRKFCTSLEDGVVLMSIQI